MKRCSLKKVGKRGKNNLKALQQLKEIYTGRPYICELRLEDCTGALFLGFAHRHKRDWYYKRPELLGTFEQTILACSNCHAKIEHNKQLTEDVFNKLRGVEDGL